MKALSVAQKKFLYEQCVYGRLRFIAKPCYGFLIQTVLLSNRFIDVFSAKNKTDVSQLTLLIKTFERHYAVNRLVKSIKRHYPDIKIIVVDDSQKPTHIDGVEMITLPYDSGISVGRNAALDIIDSKYFLLLDDDFVFSRRQKLGELIAEMEKYPNIDILGGRVIDLPFYIVHNFHDTPFTSNKPEKIKIGTKYGQNKVVTKTQNFFIARTEAVKKVKWNESLKVAEHTDFFTRAHGELTTAFRETLLILHAKTPFDRAYLAKRFRSIKPHVSNSRTF